MLFLHHIWPQVPQLHFLEFFYRSTGCQMSIRLTGGVNQVDGLSGLVLALRPA